MVSKIILVGGFLFLLKDYKKQGVLNEENNSNTNNPLVSSFYGWL